MTWLVAAAISWVGFLALIVLALRWCSGSDVTDLPDPPSPRGTEPEDVIPIRYRRAA